MHSILELLDYYLKPKLKINIVQTTVHEKDASKIVKELFPTREYPYTFEKHEIALGDLPANTDAQISQIYLRAIKEITPEIRKLSAIELYDLKDEIDVRSMNFKSVSFMYHDEDLNYNNVIKVIVKSDYEYPVEDFSNRRIACRKLESYFKEMIRLIKRVDEIRLNTIALKDGEIEPKRINKPPTIPKVKNWRDHSINHKPNIELLRNVLRSYLEPKDIKHFYDLLDSNDTTREIIWKGQANELHALINGIADNPAFKSKQKFAYFRSRVFYIGEGGQMKTTESEFKKHTYDKDSKQFSELYNLGRNLE